MAAASDRPARVASRWRYGRWDGTQEPAAVSAGDVLAAVADDVLYHGDLDAALRRALQQGFTTSSGERVAGLRDLLDRIRSRREELVGSGDLGRVHERAGRTLDEVLATERAELDRAGRGSPDAAWDAAEAHARLDLLPPGLAARIRELSGYEWASHEAAAGFAELVSELRSEVAQLHLDRAAAAAAAAGPEEREHLRSGLAALNDMLEQRADGRPLDPTFEQLMADYGDLFPDGARDLDELVSQIAERMAAASALLASMSPGQRAELAALSEELLADVDLAWQVDRLGGNLRAARSSLPWDRAASLGGEGEIGLAAAGELYAELGRLDELAAVLRSVTQPGELAEVDAQAVAELLGTDAARELAVLEGLTRALEADGLVGRRDGRLEMTARGLRRLGARALEELFSRLSRDRVGEHPVGVAGVGHDRDPETAPYEHGDALRLHVERTLKNALVRRASEGRGAASLPVRLTVDDFEVERNEHLSAASTVLALDLSLSMPMRDNFLAAKKVAMALQSLISSRFPREYLGIVGFSATAREIRPDELPEVSWDLAYGTNLQHALALSRSLLGRRRGAKQVVVITDGEPTAHVLPGGDVLFDYPPARETTEATLAEVVRCTREGITINTFVLDATGELRAFTEKMTRVNGGRAFFTTPDELGGYVLVDFVERRAGRARRVGRGA